MYYTKKKQIYFGKRKSLLKKKNVRVDKGTAGQKLENEERKYYIEEKNTDMDYKIERYPSVQRPSGRHQPLLARARLCAGKRQPTSDQWPFADWEDHLVKRITQNLVDQVDLGQESDQHRRLEMLICKLLVDQCSKHIRMNMNCE